MNTRTYKIFFFATILNLDVSLAEDLEWEVPGIRFYFGLVILAANETFGVKHTFMNIDIILAAMERSRMSKE
jgi:hypothetical protein